MTRYQLIDVSVWQGDIDWEQVKPHIDGAIIRCSDGKTGNTTPDPKFERNSSECERLDIPYGVYVYSYARTANDARKEATNALKFIKDKKLSYPVFFDSEEKGTQNGARECATAFMEVMEFAGIVSGIYASRSWYNNYLKGIDCRVLWIAAWNNTGAGIPCDIWQYSNNGNIPGINGRVDLDVCYKTFEAYFTPKEPENTKTVDELAQEVLAGMWGNGNTRKKRLTEAGYDYQKVQDKVNEIIYGKEIKVGSKIMIRQGAKQYNRPWGFASFVYQREYYVTQINGDRVVFATNNGIIMGAVNRKDCIIK